MNVRSTSNLNLSLTLVDAKLVDLIGTCLGLGLVGFGPKGLGTRLDNSHTVISFWYFLSS